MKRILAAIGFATALFAGCKEVPPPINFGGGKSVDTTYVVSPVPPADPHNVLIEDFTGQGCSNCPAAHNTLVGIENAHTGHVNIVSLYITHFNQTDPPSGSVHDFRDSVASVIGTNIYGGIGSMPIAGVDRVYQGGAAPINMQIGQSNWGDLVNNLVAMNDSINIGLTSSFNSGTNTATIVATITYLHPMITQQNLSIVVVEDSIIDFQEIFAPTQYPHGVDSTYAFTNVFRGMLTFPPLGDPILSTMTSKEAGRVYRRTYTYTPKSTSPAINPNNCRVVAFVNSNGTNGDYHILQSVQTKLAP